MMIVDFYRVQWNSTLQCFVDQSYSKMADKLSDKTVKSPSLITNIGKSALAYGKMKLQVGAIIMLVVGIILIGVGIWLWDSHNNEKARFTGETDNGVVLEMNQYKNENLEGETKYNLNVTYKYQVNGEDYEGDFTYPMIKLGKVNTIRDKLNKKLTVIYDPNSPGESMLEFPTSIWWILIIAGAGCLGVSGISWYFRNSKFAQGTTAANDALSVLD